jgi:DNA-binding MarR family transcriptional regulator
MTQTNEANPLGIAPDDLLEAKRAIEKVLKQIQKLADDGSQLPSQRADFADFIYKSRRLRQKFFPEDIFADPAWDILLLLYSLEHSRRRVSLSAVCASAGVPESTGHRWIDRLMEIGMVYREKHPNDRRIYWLRLTERTLRRLDSCFDEIASSFRS